MAAANEVAMETNKSDGSSPSSPPGGDQQSSPTTKSPPAGPAVADEVTTPSSSRSRTTRNMGARKQPVKKAVAKRPPKKPKWDAETILTDPESPLASADLRNLLSSPMAWDVLDTGDKAEILALFPDRAYVLDPDTEEARPDFQALMNDDTFRHDCATYTDHVAQGRFDPEWLACAWTAHERRKMGDFDQHLNAKFEEDWQVDLPEDFKPKRSIRGAEAKEEAANDQATESKDAIDQPTEGKDGEKHESGERDEANRTHHDDATKAPVATTTHEDKEARKDADNMIIDELQVEDEKRRVHSMPMVRRQSTKMEIDAESEDELA